MFTVTGEGLVSLVSPLLSDTLVNQELSELMSDPVIDALGTSDTSPLSAVVPKVRCASISQTYTQS